MWNRRNNYFDNTPDTETEEKPVVSTPLIKNIKILNEEIKKLLNNFEEINGRDLVHEIKFKRYNGSNNAYGKIVDVYVTVQVS